MVKRKICTIPTCNNVQQYPSLGLCQECYKARWFQVRKMERLHVNHYIELTIKAMTKHAIDFMRTKNKAENPNYSYEKTVQIPRSKYHITLKVFKH